MALFCLFLLFIIAAPVQGQTSTPVPPMQLTNPTELASCGLPATSSVFTSESTITTFDLTADCTYYRWSARSGNAVLYITSGTFIINGNGHTIEGPPHSYTIYVQGSGTVLNLNNAIIRQSGNSPVIAVRSGASLNGRNLIFSENSSSTVLSVNNSQATLRNVQFLNNRQSNPGSALGIASAITAQSGGEVTIINGIFRGNRNHSSQTDVIASDSAGAHVRLQGCITFENNVQSDGTTEANKYGRYANAGTVMGRVTDSNDGVCPAEGFSFDQPARKSKKTATPRPSATPRPPATCIDLNLTTDIVVHATHGLGNGVQCQRLGGGGIGFQALADSFIDAVDVWGYVEQGVKVCFPQSGELLFLDARMMPRAVTPLASTVVNGMTCGAIKSPGSIVLMPHS